MSVMKKINLKNMDRNLSSVVLLCSRIKSYQEELACIEERLSSNKSELSSGILSKKLFAISKNSTQRERKRIERHLEENTNNVLKKLDDIESILKQVEF